MFLDFTFSIVSGIQSMEHPHPGRAFFAVGFPRTCFLPDCPLGRKVSDIIFILNIYGRMCVYICNFVFAFFIF